MEIRHLFTDRISFETMEEIKAFTANSKNCDPRKESPERSNALLIFSTSKQQTWLVATEHRLYCILDDIRKPKPHINWSMERSDIFDSNDKIVISIGVREKSKKTGLVDIGTKHHGWLFSKKLFSNRPIEAMISSMLQNSMVFKKFQ